MGSHGPSPCANFCHVPLDHGRRDVSSWHSCLFIGLLFHTFAMLMVTPASLEADGDGVGSMTTSEKHTDATLDEEKCTICNKRLTKAEVYSCKRDHVMLSCDEDGVGFQS